MDIQPRYLTLADLLAKRLFRIPRYQRAYSWQRKQRNDMFDDISSIRRKQDSFHFMATVVGLRRETKTIVTDQYSVVEVVDGQQRLTTIVLLLKAIEKKLARSLPEEDRLARELKELLVKQDNVSLILLQTNHDRSHYFVNYLRLGACSPVREARTLADYELLSAIHQCESFVDTWNDRIELLRIIKNQLTFIFHEIDDEAAVYTVFEVLNNRGLHVSWLDRLKSMLMSVVFEHSKGNADEHIEELHQIWGTIYETIGLRQGLSTEALRFGATLKSPSRISKPFGEEKAVESLIDMCNNNAFKAIEISNWLLKVTLAVDKFLEDTKGSREAVTKISHARLAVAIILRGFSPDEETYLLNVWENTSFRVFGLCRKDARTGVGDYVRLAWDTLNNARLNADTISGKIRNISEGKEHSIDWGLLQLENENCYEGWEDELRYLLFRYEEHLAKQQGQTFSNEQWNRIWEASAAQSIEHILPQSKGSQERLKPGQEGVFVHRLGNLLLLPPGLNSELNDLDPTAKADSYLQTGLLQCGDVAKTIKRDGWSAKQVEERERQLLEWVRSTWS
ncbi:DUF262 domain-containing protein [Candidatus Poribacteria bacterium]|nr:DUF262 domain-containing protein [Candidatus Poribacteria bacterium]